jgi:hypothetical protein
MITRTRHHLTRYALPPGFLKYRSHDCQARSQVTRDTHADTTVVAPRRVLGSSLSTLFRQCSPLTFICNNLTRINGRTFQRQRLSVDRATTKESPSFFSGSYAEHVFVRDIQQTAKDTSKYKPGWGEKVVATAEERSRTKRWRGWRRKGEGEWESGYGKNDQWRRRRRRQRQQQQQQQQQHNSVRGHHSICIRLQTTATHAGRIR